MTIAPNRETIGGRLKVERQRLQITQAALAETMGVARRTVIAWEANGASILGEPLARFADAGADVMFIITGRRCPNEQPTAGVTVRQALAMLDPVDRHRLLLDLLADELRA